MNKIFAITDYKNHFGSKWKSQPYRSGFDKSLLEKCFNDYGWDIVYIRLKDVDFKDDWHRKIVLYTSSEEQGLHYKTFIEDVVLGLERMGAIVIPRFDFLRANNNKVYMEILRTRFLRDELSGISSSLYGTLEELKFALTEDRIEFPCVLKTAEGAMSRGVFLANNRNELLRIAKRISLTLHYPFNLKETVRSKRHRGYQKESKYQRKFIIQNFIPNLKNDWKVLVFGNHYYVLCRGIKSDDFRASGSHHNYLAGSKSGITDEMLHAIREVYEMFNVPHLSLDFAWDGSKSIIFEFQAIHFGKSTMEFSKDLFVFENSKWKIVQANYSQEEEYVYGIIHYLTKHPKVFN